MVLKPCQRTAWPVNCWRTKSLPKERIMAKPNFIIFLTDDQGYGDLSCMGTTDFRTPHIDDLAATGARFTSWYSNSPVSSPSRASLLTGRYPGNAGVRSILAGHRTATGLPPQVPTIASGLKKLGYQTFIAASSFGQNGRRSTGFMRIAASHRSLDVICSSMQYPPLHFSPSSSASFQYRVVRRDLHLHAYESAIGSPDTFLIRQSQFGCRLQPNFQ